MHGREWENEPDLGSSAREIGDLHPATKAPRYRDHQEKANAVTRTLAGPVRLTEVPQHLRRESRSMVAYRQNQHITAPDGREVDLPWRHVRRVLEQVPDRLTQGWVAHHCRAVRYGACVFQRHGGVRGLPGPR